MSTLLTIDLDYWTHHYDNVRKDGQYWIKSLVETIDNAYVISLHHHILNLIQPHHNKIINVDFHNDIIGESNYIGEVEEGTWGNFLPSNIKEFEWCYPSYKQCVKEKWGLCRSNHIVKKNYPIQYKQFWNYKNVDYSDVDMIVICVSKEWENVIDIYKKYLNFIENKKDIPIVDKDKPKKIVKDDNFDYYLR